MVALMFHLTEYQYSQSFYEYKYHHLNIFYVLCYNVIVSQSCLALLCVLCVYKIDIVRRKESFKNEFVYIFC